MAGHEYPYTPFCGVIELCWIRSSVGYIILSALSLVYARRHINLHICMEAALTVWGTLKIVLNHIFLYVCTGPVSGVRFKRRK